MRLTPVQGAWKKNIYDSLTTPVHQNVVITLETMQELKLVSSLFAKIESINKNLLGYEAGMTGFLIQRLWMILVVYMVMLARLSQLSKEQLHPYAVTQATVWLCHITVVTLFLYGNLAQRTAALHEHSRPIFFDLLEATHPRGSSSRSSARHMFVNGRAWTDHFDFAHFHTPRTVLGNLAGQVLECLVQTEMGMPLSCSAMAMIQGLRVTEVRELFLQLAMANAEACLCATQAEGASALACKELMHLLLMVERSMWMTSSVNTLYDRGVLPRFPLPHTQRVNHPQFKCVFIKRLSVSLCVCVFITAGPITKLFAGGGGGEWRTCDMRDEQILLQGKKFVFSRQGWVLVYSIPFVFLEIEEAGVLLSDSSKDKTRGGHGDARRCLVKGSVLRSIACL
jgi:hypothetical protein